MSKAIVKEAAPNKKPAPVDEMYLPTLSVGDEDGGDAHLPVATMAVEPEIDDTIVIGSPSNSRHPSTVSVYAESINSAGTYAGDCEVCSFDVVFSVGISEGDVSKTYRVIKRIGIDKVKLAQEAECATPVSIVEEKTEAKKAATAAQTKRFRQMAGLE